MKRCIDCLSCYDPEVENVIVVTRTYPSGSPPRILYKCRVYNEYCSGLNKDGDCKKYSELSPWLIIVLLIGLLIIAILAHELGVC